MAKSIPLLLFIFLFTSCKNKTEEPRPDRTHTLSYLSENLTNSFTVIGYSSLERSISFQVTGGDDVTYVSDFRKPDSNIHWELTNRFSLSDISYVSESTTNKIRNIALELKNRNNHRITRSLNGKSINTGFPEDEMIRTVFITVEPDKFDGVKKAFENLLYLRREHN